MNEEEYLAAVDWVALKHAQHPLLPSLRQGYSRINLIYLKKALQDVGKPQESSIQEAVVEATDPVLVKLQRERRTLFTHRAKLSNYFHECKTDQQRAANSDEIRIVQRKIEVCLRSIRIYKKTGKLPEQEDVEELTGIALMKKYRSTLSNISIKKRNLKHAAHARDERTKNQIAKWEAALKKLENEKLRLERLIARESI